MWWFKFSLPLVVGLAIIQASTAVTIEDRFTSLPLMGGCGDAQIAWLNSFITDVETLYSGFQDAMTAAQRTTYATGIPGREAIVARELFTKWFGIQFQDKDASKAQIPTSAYKEHWQQITDTLALIEAFVSSGSLAGPGLSTGTKPWLSCAGFPAMQKAGWGQQVIKTDPTTGISTPISIGNQPLTVSELMTLSDNDMNSYNPYILYEKSFYGTFGSSFGADVCGKTADGIQPFGFSNPGRYQSQLTIRSEAYDLEEIEPGMIICPAVFNPSATTGVTTSALYQVTWLDPSKQVQIATVEPAGTTLFHELTHMTSYWSGNGDGTTDGRQSKVIDITYDPLECLTLAKGAFTKTLPNQETVSYTSYDSTLNAQTYTYFAYAWWYYQQTWTYKDETTGSTKVHKPATFYGALLQEWDAKGDSTTGSSSN